MQRLTSQILSYLERLPEGTALSAKSLLHLGNRAALDQALSRLHERGELIRAGRGVYLKAIKRPVREQAADGRASGRGGRTSTWRGDLFRMVQRQPMLLGSPRRFQSAPST